MRHALLSGASVLALSFSVATASAQAPPPPEAPPAAPPPGYAPPPPAYAPPPPGYGAPPPGYGAPPPGYGYGVPPPGYPPPPGYAPPAYYPHPYGYYAPYAPPGYYGGPGTGPVPELKERFSTPMMVVGISLTALGAIGIFAGAFMLGESESTNCVYYDAASYNECGPDEDLATSGAVLLVAGGITAVIGIPLIVVGARKVPKQNQDPTQISLRPDVLVGRRSAALRWSF